MAQTEPASSIEQELPHKEVRFAVVMYGGVSLAIYIHGVAQELLSLVRATARDKQSGKYWVPEEDLKGAEMVYRSLGEAIKAKFIVDILSGTSAGGINAVYLAKALVNDKSMDGLKDLWVREGDIAKLVNDEESILGLSGLRLTEPPEALLNSQRMYYKLLQALNTMGSSDKPSPFVEQLDLNITATDIRGLNLPIKIRNRSINELRYKTVFRFRYHTEKTFTAEHVAQNDFRKEKDPFLAFAARCTSSIPPAFEAVQLKDIEPVLQSGAFRDEYRAVMDVDTEEWRDFYGDYVRAGDAFSTRFFGDGGYLDNKPFSYATEDLRTRRADLPVDRKLIYIEPSPEHPEDRPLAEGRPNMLQNVLAALVGLPRQETIRDDLSSILARNQDISRANKVFSRVQNVFNKTISAQREFDTWNAKCTENWQGKYLDGVIGEYGLHYPAYHQLRMENVLDTLASILARGMGWDNDPEGVRDLRVLLDAWRERYYAALSADVSGKESKLKQAKTTGSTSIHSESDMLYRLDINWRRRRMYFVHQLANTLLDSLEPAETPEHEAAREQAKILRNLSGTEAEWVAAFDARAAYRLAIEELKEKLNLIDVGFNRRLNKVQQYNLVHATEIDAGLQHYAARLKTLRDVFAATMGSVHGRDTTLREFARQLRNRQWPGDARINDVLEQLEQLSTALSPHSEEKVEDSSSYLVKDALRFVAFRSTRTLSSKDEIEELEKAKASGSASDEPGGIGYMMPMNSKIPVEIYRTVQQTLRYFYDRFEYYDMMIYPLQFGADFGESDEVEIIRVSPEDATRLLDERASGRMKLAGTKLSNFGAFFKQEWRENDMLWGRLDAAELLLTELLDPNSPQGDRYLKRFRAALWGRLSPEEQKRYGDKQENLNPYDLAFERILEQDLRPRDIGLFYEFINGESPPAEPRKASAAPPARANSPELEALLKQQRQLDRLESDLHRFKTDRGLDRLASDLYQTLKAKPDLGTDQLRQKLEEQIKQIEKEKSELSQRINEEQQRLASIAAKAGTEQQENLEKLDNAGEFLQSLPETIRKKSQEVLAQFQRNDTIRYRTLLRAVAKGGDLLHYFRYGYDVDKDFEPRETVLVAERSARTLNRLLQGLSEQYPIQKPLGLLAFLLQIVTAIIDLALPKKIGNFLFFGYWIWLLYIAEGMIWFAGTLTANEAISSVGSLAFLTTIGLHFLVFQVNRFIVRSSRRRYAVWIFYAAALLIWLLGRWLGHQLLANVGWTAFAVLAGIHAASNVGRLWPVFRWLAPALVSLLTLTFLAIFALGLIYLGVFEPGGWVAGLIQSVQQLISK